MESAVSQGKAPAGHPRLLRCQVRNAAGKQSVRFVELEQFRLWEYMMQTRHGIEVTELQLGLWLTESEFQDNSELFLRSGEVENVSRITIKWFNPRHHYTLDIVRYALAAQCESIKKILLSHIARSKRESPYFNLEEQRGICVSRVIEDPGVELILGLADMEVESDEPAA